MIEKAIAAGFESGATALEHSGGLIDEAAGVLAGRIGSSQAVRRNISESVAELAKILVRDKPQVNQEGKLQWYFAGSVGSNLIAGAERITELDGTRFPGVVHARNIELGETARQSLESFTRPVGDIDIVRMPGATSYGKGGTGLGFSDLPDKARSAFKVALDGRKIWFDPLNVSVQPPVAIEVGGTQMYVTHPASSLAFKMVHAMESFPNAQTDKMTGDFDRLYTAARNFMPDADLAEVGLRALEKHSPLGYGAFLHDYDPAWAGPLKTFSDRVIGLHPESTHLQDLGSARAYSVPILRAMSRLNEDGQTSVARFVKENKNMLESWRVNSSSEMNRRLVARELIQNDPEQAKSITETMDKLSAHTKESAPSESPEDRVVRALAIYPGLVSDMGETMQGLKRRPATTYWMDALQNIDPNRVDSELTNLQYLGRRGVPVFNIARAMKGMTGQDPAVRDEMWSSLKHAADKGLSPRELDRETFDISSRQY